MKTATIICSSLVILFTAGNSFAAITFNIQGVNDSNNTAEVVFSYSAASDTSATIDVKITNTTLVYDDPRITSFAFNAPSSITGLSIVNFAASGTGNDADWEAQLDLDSINTPGSLGKFDIAGITGPNFNGGNPDSGIVKATTGMFTIDLSAAGGLLSLDENSFLSELSVDENESYNFAARFQRTGADGGGSDVAVVPEPGTVVIWSLLVLAGLVLQRRYRFFPNFGSVAS